MIDFLLVNSSMYRRTRMNDRFTLAMASEADSVSEAVKVAEPEVSLKSASVKNTSLLFLRPLTFAPNDASYQSLLPEYVYAEPIPIFAFFTCWAMSLSTGTA